MKTKILFIILIVLLVISLIFVAYYKVKFIQEKQKVIVFCDISNKLIDVVEQERVMLNKFLNGSLTQKISYINCSDEKEWGLLEK